jgi:hypothetical protein
LWLDGRGLRSIAVVTPPDRKTIRQVVDVAAWLGLDRDGGVGQRDDAFMSLVRAELAPRAGVRRGLGGAQRRGQRLAGGCSPRALPDAATAS